jgi:nucleotide-binding universal stress UspA family protein
MLSLRTVLHPTDFSEPSRYAFQLACSLARDSGARLIVLHVAVPPVVAYGEMMTALATEGKGKEALEVRLRQLVQGAGPPVAVEHRVEEVADPAEAICRVAREAACDLIVMGTHGRRGLERVLMGSVAEQVVRQSPCPVLTVKTPVPGTSPAVSGPEAGAATA